jgi:hypothetical protein
MTTCSPNQHEAGGNSNNVGTPHKLKISGVHCEQHIRTSVLIHLLDLQSTITRCDVSPLLHCTLVHACMRACLHEVCHYLLNCSVVHISSIYRHLRVD